MASTTDIRKGLKIQIDGVPFHVVEHQFVKPGKGQSFTRCSVRNLTNGKVVEKTWKSGESVELGLPPHGTDMLEPTIGQRRGVEQ